MACLAKGSWPELAHLDVAACGLDKASMLELVQGQWHILAHINLSANPDLDDAAIVLLHHSVWILSSVSLQCMEVNPKAVRSLTQLKAVIWLDICWTGLKTTSISLLAQNRRSFVALSLTGNCLGAEAMAALVTADMPELEFLDLAENDLHAVATEVLSAGYWPMLSGLCLTDNMLDDAAMQHLTLAGWPSLSRLGIAVIRSLPLVLDSSGVKQIGNWIASK